ncbi:MAG: hypothetical protein PF517_00640 [Salinivirgaceae bacterium]|jgi:hypothetical protein|nr:hypothetical protein [Salinivirgaceae bacterium]
MNQDKELPSIFYSIIGFAAVLAWFITASYTIQIFFADSYSGTLWYKVIDIGFKNSVYWKPFSICCFILGLWLNFKFQKQLSNLHLPHWIWYSWLALLFVLIATISLVAAETIQSEPFFAPLYTFNHAITSASITIPVLYGLIITTIGLWAGKNNWLYEYHFHFIELKKLFNYSIMLLVLWHLLKLLGIYTLITHAIIGKTIYMIDALTINVLMVFIYLFVLIYLENFKFGKRVLTVLEYLGRYWYLSAFILVIIIFFQA